MNTLTASILFIGGILLLVQFVYVSILVVEMRYRTRKQFYLDIIPFWPVCKFIFLLGHDILVCVRYFKNLP